MTIRLRVAGLVLLATSIVGAPPGAAQDVDLGEREYMDRCAVCHGRTGTGDGPMSRLLTVEVPDLTVLQANNDGVFPFQRVYDTIDGREMVEAHGTREMPVWGRAYGGRADQAMAPFWPYDREGYIRARILALTEYIHRLQGE
jgi:mono/diheme cytochrome c family protein